MDYSPLRIVRFSGAALTDGIEEHQIDGVTVPSGQRDAPLHGKPVMNERNVAASVRARLLNRARE